MREKLETSLKKLTTFTPFAFTPFTFTFTFTPFTSTEKVTFWPKLTEEHGAENARKALETSLKKLGLDYVDLYLIHVPKGGKIIETWNTLLELKKEGLAKAVGE